MRHRTRVAGVLVLSMVPLFVVAAADGQSRTIPFADARLKIEYNATDGDAGLQVFLDAEPWRSISITNPRGREVLEVDASVVIRNFGLTELFSESSEPPFDEFPFEEFKELFPEGTYTFRGTTIEGDSLRSSFRFTHRVPGAPHIVAPEEGAVLPPWDLMVQWDPVSSPPGVRIAAYQVLVVADAPARGNPTRVLDVTLPATATRLPVPAVFLVPGGYKTEVLAIEEGGNQTLTQVAFTIRG